MHCETYEGIKLFRSAKGQIKSVAKLPSSCRIISVYACRPRDTPYEGGHFVVALKVPREYPMVPPAASFKTKIFHPNVLFSTGEICLDILKTSWSPAWTLQSVCRVCREPPLHPSLPPLPFHPLTGQEVQEVWNLARLHIQSYRFEHGIAG